MIRKFSQMGLAAWLGGCATASAVLHEQVVPLYGLEGRWIGPVVPQAAGCGPTAKGVLVVSTTGFAFDPFQTTIIVRGSLAAGALHGSDERVGLNGQTLSIVFDASAGRDPTGAEVVRGELVSARCRWQVTLRRG